MSKTLSRIAAALLNEPWLIQEQWLQEMYAIFRAHVSDSSSLASLEGLYARGIPPQNKDESAVEYSRRKRGVYRRGATAVIPIQGPIFPKANLMTEFCGATSLDLVMADFQEAEADDTIRNIVFPGDSPGGVVTQVDEFGQMLSQCGKPTYGHVSGYGASAMYWLLSQMSEISISPTSSVGSIGVIMSMTKNQKAGPDEYPKELQFVSSISPKKRLDPESKEGETEIYAMVNKIAEVFANSVAAGRKVSLETVLEQFGKGGMLTGDAALAVGMVDHVDTLEALLTRLDEEKPIFYSYGESPMNRAEYKLKFPVEHDAIRAEGVAEGAASLSHLTVETTTLRAENARLKADLDKTQADADERAAKLKDLEKRDAIRAEKANATVAESVFAAAFKDSGIPTRLEAKVRNSCDAPEAHTKDGVLDAEAYKTSITAEMSDWVKSLNLKTETATTKTELKGIGSTGVEGENDDADVAAVAAADKMFASLNIAKAT